MLKFKPNQKFQVIPVPMLKDNYAYLLVNKKQAFAVDPVEPEKILAKLKEEQLELTGILTTHHHWDHAGGNEGIF